MAAIAPTDAELARARLVAVVRSGLLSSTGFDALRMLGLAGILLALGIGAVGMRWQQGRPAAPTRPS